MPRSEQLSRLSRKERQKRQERQKPETKNYKKKYQLDSVQLRHFNKLPVTRAVWPLHRLSPAGGLQKPVCLPKNRPGRAQGR